MNPTHITLVGNAATDPDLRHTPNGVVVASFRLAINTRRKDANGNWTDGDPSFYTVTTWRDLAENLTETIAKGDRVLVIGRLRQRSWETEQGDKRTVTEIDADEIGPALRWATAKLTRTRKNGTRPTDDGDPGSWSEPPPF